MTQQDFVGHSDLDLIALIAQKTTAEISETDPGFVEGIGGMLTFLEVIKAVHDINPLRLAEMLEGNEMNRAHDVLGMLRHYDWASNELTECFLPRYTK